MVKDELKNLIKEAIEEYNKSVLVNLNSAETKEFVRELVREVLKEFREKECVCPDDPKWRSTINSMDPTEVLDCYNFTKDWKDSIYTAKKTGIVAVITTLITGILGLIWLALKS